VPYRTVTHDGVTLLCFPPHDEVFARLAAQHLASLPTPDPDELCAKLTETYPDAVVRRREALASLGHGEAWYSYRDGRYSPFTDDRPWWDDPDVARLEIDDDGRYLDASPAALELIGVDVDGLRSLRSGDLTDPATRPTVPWVWQLLKDVGMLHSTSMLVRPDGGRLAVEYRLILNAAGAGRHVSFVRPVPAAAAEPLPVVAVGD
jgi:PAS domain-containing protein